MRILFVTPQPPWPPRQGTALRNLHLLRALASVHEVDLLTFIDPAEADRSEDDETTTPPGPPDPLVGLCRRIVTVPVPARPLRSRLCDLVAGRADMAGRLRSAAFAARLATMLAETAYDVVQLEGFEVAGYLLGPPALRAEAHGRVPWERAPQIVFDDHNAEYQLQESAARIDAGVPRRWPRAAYSAIQARRLRAREALYAAAADACLAVSREDALAIGGLVPGLRVAVVPNGVDVAGAPPAAPGPVPTVLFVGKLDYRPNVDACEWLVQEILPRVQASVPDLRVVLAGRDPAPAVRRLARPGVEVTGAISGAELARRRSGAWVEVAPLRMGSGVRFKAIEAMAAGVPLVATPLGAAGTGAVSGEQALIAVDAVAFGDAVAGLLLAPERRRALAAAARALAAAHHDWSRITPSLLAVYDGLRRPAAEPEPGPSVAATVRNERDSIDALLASLGAQSCRPAACVFVDGGSTDGTVARLQRATTTYALTVLSRPGANISQGRNAAVGAAAGQVVAVTDAGVRLGPEWLARLTTPLRRDPLLAATSGFFVSDPHGVWELALGATTLPDVEEIDPLRFLPSSRSVAFRREAWRRAGAYPEWLDYGEDLVFDLALRRCAGPLRFVPRATVRFRPRPTPAAFFKQYFRYARGDGKAGLWPRRHAIRYGAYLFGVALLALIRRRDGTSAPALAVLLVGAGAYLRRPFIRLTQASVPRGDRWRAVPLVPVVRVIGDVAKMLGYPAGLWWRLGVGRGGADRADR